MYLVTQAQKGWIAGIIDGEGSIGLRLRPKPDRKRKTTYQLILSVEMTHEQTVVHFKNLCATGTYEGLCKTRSGNRKPSYKFVASGRSVLFILSHVKELIVTKREQMILAFKFGEIYPIDSRGEISEARIAEVEVIHAKLYVLNQRGVHVCDPASESVNIDLSGKTCTDLSSFTNPSIKRFCTELSH